MTRCPVPLTVPVPDPIPDARLARMLLEFCCCVYTQRTDCKSSGTRTHQQRQHCVCHHLNWVHFLLVRYKCICKIQHRQRQAIRQTLETFVDCATFHFSNGSHLAASVNFKPPSPGSLYPLPVNDNPLAIPGSARCFLSAQIART